MYKKDNSKIRAFLNIAPWSRPAFFWHLWRRSSQLFIRGWTISRRWNVLLPLAFWCFCFFVFLLFSWLWGKSRQFVYAGRLISLCPWPQVNIDVTDASLPLPLRGSFCGPVACYGSLTACHKICNFDVLWCSFKIWCDQYWSVTVLGCDSYTCNQGAAWVATGDL